MSKLEQIWTVFKKSSMQDKDMQKAFNRAATPNECIELLEQNEELKNDIQFLMKQLCLIEHMQDRKAISKVFKKYNYDPWE